MRIGLSRIESKLIPCIIDLQKEKITLLSEYDINSVFAKSLESIIELQTDDRYPMGKVKLHAPVQPSKMVCIGRNYVEHAEEFGTDPPSEPILFLKPLSSVIGSEQPIILPKISNRVDFEGELALVIRRRIKNEQADDLKNSGELFGLTCFNDVTARDIQRKDGQWTRGKSFDTFACIGPWVTIDQTIDPCQLRIMTKVNGVVRQDSSTKLMIFPPYELVSFISQVMTLEPGDIIATGTPSGVGSLNSGDIVEVGIEGIGILRNTVVEEI